MSGVRPSIHAQVLAGALALLLAGCASSEGGSSASTAAPAATKVSEAGSVRRRRETVRDLDLVATSSDPPALIAAFCEGDWVSEVAARGDTKATVVSHEGLRFDLRYFSNLKPSDAPDVAIGRVHLTYWTASVGVVFRY